MSLRFVHGLGLLHKLVGKLGTGGAIASLFISKVRVPQSFRTNAAVSMPMNATFGIGLAIGKGGGSVLFVIREKPTKSTKLWSDNFVCSAGS